MQTLFKFSLPNIGFITSKNWFCRLLIPSSYTYPLKKFFKVWEKKMQTLFKFSLHKIGFITSKNWFCRLLVPSFYRPKMSSIYLKRDAASGTILLSFENFF